MARNVTHDMNNGCSKFSCICMYTTEDGTKTISRILSYWPEFPMYSDTVYRGIFIEEESLAHYAVGKRIISTTFISTSPDIRIADVFGAYNRRAQELEKLEEGKASFLSIYTIKNYNGRRTAINISQVSQFPDEGEVLILPYSEFVIKNITIKHLTRGKRIEIELEELAD
ncbi:unnamed protein product [Rotaria magnacalcarata]